MSRGHLRVVSDASGRLAVQIRPSCLNTTKAQQTRYLQEDAQLFLQKGHTTFIATSPRYLGPQAATVY